MITVVVLVTEKLGSILTPKINLVPGDCERGLIYRTAIGRPGSRRKGGAHAFLRHTSDN